MSGTLRSILRSVVLTMSLVAATSHGARLKDLVSIKGVRPNPLTGYGIVIGLSATGDSGELASNSLAQVLRSLGIEQKQALETKNSAAVLVTAQLPPFAKVGSAIDITVSSIGNASSLEGGTLLMTSLRAADGKTYAMAQGKILLQTRKQGSSSKATGSLLTAIVPSGATVERELEYRWSELKSLRYQLNSPDFTTAARIAKSIDDELAGKYATAIDAAGVEVIMPYGFEGSTVDLIARLEPIEIEADRRAKVVLDPRTGTVVLGDRVQILPVAIAHGDLHVEVRKSRTKAGGQGAAAKPGGRVVLIKHGSAVADLVKALNAIGAGADELTSILQGLRASGALQAELEVL